MCTSKYPCWSLKYPCLKLQTCFGCCKTMYGETTSHSEVYLTLSARNTAGLCKSWDGESPALVDVLKRKINGKKHSNSYFSLEAPLLCWSVSIKTEERSFQRSLAQTEFPLPSMGNCNPGPSLGDCLVSQGGVSPAEAWAVCAGMSPTSKSEGKKRVGKQIIIRSDVGITLNIKDG